MSADLYLHAIDKEHVTERLIKYLSAEWHGSAELDALFEATRHTDNIWIASNSTLKRMLFSDEQYVPDICDKIWDLMGESQIRTLDEELKTTLIGLLDIPDNSMYNSEGWRSGKHYSQPEQKQLIIDFLNRNMGKELFAVNE